MNPSSLELLAPAAGRDTEHLVHVLAQAPDRIVARLPRPPGSEVVRLVRAYGLEDRLRVGAPPSAHTRGSKEGWRAGVALARAVDGLLEPGEVAADRRGDDRLVDGERVAVVTNLPAPYRTSLWESLHERLAAAGASFRVIFESRGSSSRPWMRQPADVRFDHEWLRSVSLGGRGRRVVALDLERALRRYEPTIVVAPGFSPASSLRVAALCRRRGVTFGLWSGDTTAVAGGLSRARRAQRRWIARQAQFGLAYSSHALEYLRALRADLPAVLVRNTSDVGVAAPAPDRRGEPPSLLSIADLSSERKGVDVLVDALRLRPDLDCRLTVVGSGVLLDDLRGRAAGDARIHFPGALPPEAVRRELARSDVLLFPSRADVFGLALVEGMAAGLACVTSAAPGAVADLCVDGRNAVVVAGHEPEAWAAAIESLVADPARRARIGQAARQTVAARWTMRHSCDAWIAGFRLGVLVRDG